MLLYSFSVEQINCSLITNNIVASVRFAISPKFKKIPQIMIYIQCSHDKQKQIDASYISRTMLFVFESTAGISHWMID